MRHKAQQMRDQYDPEHDLIVGVDGSFLHVTWAEFALLEMIERLEKRVAELEAAPRSVHVEQVAEIMEGTVGLKLGRIG